MSWRLVSTWLVCLTLSSEARAQSEVAHYAFEGKPNDSAGTRDATATGGPLYAAGALGRALVLDGTDDFLTLPSDVADSEDITVAMWVLWSGGNAWQRIFDFGNDTNINMFLTPSSGAKTLRFVLKNGGPEQLIETSELTIGKWIHLAVTLQGDEATLYVDGESSATGTIVLNPAVLKARVNYVGKSQYAVDALFNGMIDELHIYDHALSASEVGELYAPRREDVAPADAGVAIDAGPRDAGATADAAGKPVDAGQPDARVQPEDEEEEDEPVAAASSGGCSLDDETHQALNGVSLILLALLLNRTRARRAGSRARPAPRGTLRGP